MLIEPGHFYNWVMQQFLELKQIDLKKESADPTILYNNEAVEHLFGVAGGLKSMMLGENQILSQVKSSYQLILSCPYSFPVLITFFRMPFGLASPSEPTQLYAGVPCPLVWRRQHWPKRYMLIFRM